MSDFGDDHSAHDAAYEEADFFEVGYEEGMTESIYSNKYGMHI